MTARAAVLLVLAASAAGCVAARASEPAPTTPPTIAEARAPAFLDALPAPLRREAVAAARWGAARHARTAPPLAAPAPDGVPEVDWDLTHAWRVGWDGRTGVDLGLSARTVLNDPRADLDRAVAGLARRRAALEAELALHDALRDWAEHRLALWRTDRRTEIVRAATRRPPPRDPDAARALAALRAIEPDLRHDRDRVTAWLQRHAPPPGTESPSERSVIDPGPAAWTAWTDRPADPDPHACSDGRADLRLARLALDEARARDDPDAPWGTAVTLGASADLAVPDIGRSPPTFGGRVWLEIGAPSAWPLSGSARSEVDPHGASLRLRASAATGVTETDPAAERRARLAAATRRYDDAAFRASAWAHATEHALRATLARLRELDAEAPAEGPPSPRTSVAALEAAWERTDLLARLTSLRMELDRVCTAARAR